MLLFGYSHKVSDYLTRSAMRAGRAALLDSAVGFAKRYSLARPYAGRRGACVCYTQNIFSGAFLPLNARSKVGDGR